MLKQNVAISMLCLALPAFAQDKGFGFDVRWEMLGFNEIGLGPIGFSNIPQSLRTVPSNQYGPLYPAGTPNIIPISTFNIGDPKILGYSSVGFAPQYTIRRFTIRGGVSITLPNSPAYGDPPTADVTAEYATYPEINQFGTNQRGVGMSLVYYSVYWSKGGSLNPEPFGEVEFRVWGVFSLIGGYGGFQKTENIILGNGYDQFDALTPYSKQALASIITKAYGPYGSAKLNLFGRYGGVFLTVIPSSTKYSSSYTVTVTPMNLKSGMELLLGVDVNVAQIIKRH